jgi:hypothetical protein
MIITPVSHYLDPHPDPILPRHQDLVVPIHQVADHIHQLVLNHHLNMIQIIVLKQKINAQLVISTNVFHKIFQILMICL